jgi:hypothetical protein
MSDPHGKHWAIRVAPGAFSVSEPGFGRSLGGNVTAIEIRNLDNGQIGTFLFGGVEFGFGFSVAGSQGNGEWAYFETVHEETLESFQGFGRISSAQYFDKSLVTRLTLPVEIEHDSLWARLWNGDSVDISGTADSLGLGVAEAGGALKLLSTAEGPPAPGLFDDVIRDFKEFEAEYYDTYATSHRDLPEAGAAPPTANVGSKTESANYPDGVATGEAGEGEGFDVAPGPALDGGEVPKMVRWAEEDAAARERMLYREDAAPEPSAGEASPAGEPEQVSYPGDDAAAWPLPPDVPDSSDPLSWPLPDDPSNGLSLADRADWVTTDPPDGPAQLGGPSVVDDDLPLPHDDDDGAPADDQAAGRSDAGQDEQNEDDEQEQDEQEAVDEEAEQGMESDVEDEAQHEAEEYEQAEQGAEYEAEQYEQAEQEPQAQGGY